MYLVWGKSVLIVGFVYLMWDGNKRVIIKSADCQQVRFIRKAQAPGADSLGVPLVFGIIPGSNSGRIKAILTPIGLKQASLVYLMWAQFWAKSNKN